jgi:hypothetical protein
MIIHRNLPISFLVAGLCLAGCAANQPESTSVEHKGKLTIVHHRRRVGNGAVDRIEAINAKGVVTTAEVHVYDVGRYVDGSGNIHEAHSVYRVVQSQRPNLMLPRTVSGGPRSIYAPPNYVPPPNDQRINDAVAEAEQAKQRLDDATKRLNERLAQDNALARQLGDAQAANASLQEQLDASMAAKQKSNPAPETDAEKAAQDATAVNALKAWGQNVSNGGQ